jgi:hypothetical protein
MKYKITYRARASQEYLSSLIWYEDRGIYAAGNFVK